ncbi:PREDICTED: matrix metalloproteinase-16-like [Trachymyrmex cornetzi]|uniref:Matrix metalloproteinase-16 n=1 Tax=Trachymyrmex cornetzi TaxID=471704 RepID=A0A151IVN5_9HYME|nr:PREDICTED: matrix metalloproteinase-16-like [Trachymyrmex cornetzi]KYN11796.1 Matrix metalloproteinase-16 [Trachymyrmex cornetzi]
MSLTFIIIIIVFVAITFTTTTTIRTAATNRESIDTEVILYLQKYGYLSKADNNTQLSFEEGELKQVISLFQEYYQIQGDGMNNYTLYQMRKPRCGRPDIYEYNIGRRKWAKTHLTWNFQLADPQTLQTTEFAFSLWAANSSLSFEHKTVNPDILIFYRSGTHTYADRRRNEEICTSSLDGPGGVLTHAFYPPTVNNYSSEIHIDSTEPWHIYLTDKSASSNKDYLLNTLIPKRIR